jgi:protein arginine kinase
MKTDLNNLSSQTGEWLRGTGSESDIVVSSRIRLARNLAHYPFAARANADQKRDLEAFLRERILKTSVNSGALYLNVNGLSAVDRMLLVERHLISRELAGLEGERGVAFTSDEVISIMVNEEDHLRIQVMRSGYELEDAWRIINDVDDKLDKVLQYAFSPRLGYLTACPTNVGTGMRLSVMLHLPALVSTRHLEKVVNAVAKLNLVVRGLYGEGTQASGDFYQISNQVTLGKSERDIIQSIEDVIPRVLEYERKAREGLLNENRKKVEDRVWRAVGILRTARFISSEETMHLLSQVRMGVNMGLVNTIDLKTINEILIQTLPAHLQKMNGRELDPEERNIVRADYIRSRMAKV